MEGLMRKRCIVCGAELTPEPIYSRENMPAMSQNLPDINDLCNDKPIDYHIFQCTGCGLVQFACEPVSYYKDSTRAGERCDILIKLRQSQYKHLIEKYNLYGKKIIEFGAGKGGFLKTLKEMQEYSVDEYGIENNSEFVRIARDEMDVNVIQADSEEEGLRIPGGPFDAFSSFAFPARLVDPNALMRNIYRNTTSDAVGIIQVPSMEHLLEPCGFFDITSDHIAYYDQKTLSFLMEKNGFEVLEIGDVAQIYIYSIVRKKRLYDVNSAWNDIDVLISQINGLVDKFCANGEKTAVWCAGHFAFTIISLCDIGNKISYIIDNAEFKQNKYSPASHVVIKGPEYFYSNPVDNILILGPIYVDEITDEIRTRFGDGVKIYYANKSGLKRVE